MGPAGWRQVRVANLQPASLGASLPPKSAFVPTPHSPAAIPLNGIKCIYGFLHTTCISCTTKDTASNPNRSSDNVGPLCITHPSKRENKSLCHTSPCYVVPEFRKICS
eukprot:GHVU01177119.1.p1 GENE.GHVU01177119.1~~GHVU01177119.1.p1  ORF type:complete len:108 (-),score=4.72 GHVU01177119.1:50-373(-)